MTRQQFVYDVQKLAQEFQHSAPKISQQEATEIVEQLNLSDKVSALGEVIVYEAFQNNPEELYRTDLLVSRLQIVLASLGVESID